MEEGVERDIFQLYSLCVYSTCQQEERPRVHWVELFGAFYWLLVYVNTIVKPQMVDYSAPCIVGLNGLQ